MESLSTVWRSGPTGLRRWLNRLHMMPRDICTTPMMMAIFILTELSIVRSVLVPCQMGSIPSRYGRSRHIDRSHAHFPYSTHASSTLSAVVVKFWAACWAFSCAAHVSKSQAQDVPPNQFSGIEKNSL